jgi:hypothetical protein
MKTYLREVPAPPMSGTGEKEEVDESKAALANIRLGVNIVSVLELAEVESTMTLQFREDVKMAFTKMWKFQSSISLRKKYLFFCKSLTCRTLDHNRLLLEWRDQRVTFR